MRKIFLSILILSLFSYLAADYQEQVQNILDNIEIQSKKYKNSDLHNSIRENKPTREYEVGDTETFWKWSFDVMPPTWQQSQATCRAVGEHCYLFVADAQWNLNMNQEDVDSIMVYLEEQTLNSQEYGTIEMDTLSFGPIPDELDNDPKLIVFYSELGSYAGSVFDGYFSAYNQVTESEAQQMNPPGHSNECEMIYMTCHPLAPAEMMRISVLSHELQHLIHWGQDIDEEIWLDEGCAELAMVYFGLPDPITAFPSNPDNSLNDWQQQFADYVKVMLYFTYLSEHYGQTNNLIYDLVSEEQNGIESIAEQLYQNGITDDFYTIFRNWTIANYLDEPDIYNGQFNYELLDLPNFASETTHSEFPVEFNDSINPWAADYIRIYPEDAELELQFQSNFPVFITCLEMGSGVQTTVTQYPEDNQYALTLPQLSENYSKLILVLSNASGEDISYEYSLTENSSTNNELVYNETSLVKVLKNPVRGNKIFFNINSSVQQISKINIFNIKGQKIKTLSVGKNIQKIFWDRTDNNGKKVSSGIYLYNSNLSMGKVKRMILVD